MTAKTIPIQLRRSTTSGAKPSPSGLLAGEPAINLADRELYSLDGDGAVFRAALSFQRAARKGRNLVSPEQMVGASSAIEVITPTWGAAGWGLRMTGAGALLVATFSGLGGLATGTSYALTFRARIVSGATSATLRVDLFPDTLPETTFDLTDSEAAEPFEWVVSSASADMASATLRFFFNPMPSGVVVEIVDIQFEQGPRPTLVGRSEADTAAVSGALPRSRGRRARDRYSAFDRIPGRLHDAIRAGSNTTDLATWLQAIAADGEDAFFPAGDYLTTQKIAPPAGRKWYGAGRTRSRIRATAAFDLAATAVIDLGSTEPGATLQDLGIVLEQPTTAANRAGLTQYPPAVLIGGPRARLSGVRISGAIDGVAAIGNTGGLLIDRLEVGAVGKGLEIDGALDFVHLPSIHIWPFGLNTGTTYSAVYKDGETIGLKIGRADGLAIGLLSTFNAKVVVDDDTETIIPIFVDSLMMDGVGARLVMNQAGRRLFVGRCYSTKSTDKVGPSIEVTAGDVYIGHVHALESGPAPTIEVSAGTCVVEGGLLANLTVDQQAVLVTGGRAVVRGARLAPPASNRTAPFIEQTGGALEVSDVRADASGGATGDLIKVGTDNAGNRVREVSANGWAITLPAGAYLGNYRENSAGVVVNARQFGLVGDGSTDDVAAIGRAATALGAKGGTIMLPPDARVLIDTDLTLPPNVHLKGPHHLVGSPKDNTLAAYGSMGGALIVNAAASIILSGGAGVSGCLVHRKGMTFPASDSSGFAGTAFTTTGDDDSFITGNMILGFSKGWYSTGSQRPRILQNWFDCTNGVEIAACADIAYVIDNHCWPFATIAAAGAASTLQRSGTAFYLHDVGDWAQVVRNFSYGYLVGTYVKNANNVSIVGCGHDNTSSAGASTHSGSIGIKVEGTAQRTLVQGCQTAAQDVAGIVVDIDDNLHARVEGNRAWVCGIGVKVDGGDVSVIGNDIESGVRGVQVNDAASKVTVDLNRFRAMSGAHVDATVATSNLFIGQRNGFADVAASYNVLGANQTNIDVATLASAASVNLPHTGDVFAISGTTNIGGLTRGWAGRRVTLVFTGSLTMLHSIGAGNLNAIYLAGQTNFAVRDGSTLHLVHDGTQWREIGRAY